MSIVYNSVSSNVERRDFQVKLLKRFQYDGDNVRVGSYEKKSQMCRLHQLNSARANRGPKSHRCSQVAGQDHSSPTWADGQACHAGMTVCHALSVSSTTVLRVSTNPNLDADYQVCLVRVLATTV